jgi:hypothetical protein
VIVHVPDLEERNRSIRPRIVSQVSIELVRRSAWPDISDFIQRN